VYRTTVPFIAALSLRCLPGRRRDDELSDKPSEKYFCISIGIAEHVGTLLATYSAYYR